MVALCAACAAPQQSDKLPLATEDAAQPANAEADVPAVQAEVAAAALGPPTSCRAATTAPQWWHHTVGYEIFVRSFADSSGDGIGDLGGVISHFDYLNDGKPGGDDLGVGLLWLMPVMPSPSYHGYDVSDYDSIAKDYGSLADLDALLKLAHSRGVKVVLDFVANHTSSQPPWFAASSKGTANADWYVWRTTAAEAGWKQPWAGGGKVWHKSGNRWYYGVFSSGMPDLNLTAPAVTQALQASAKLWLDRGVDGFRLDAVRYLVETGPGAGQQDTAATLQWWQDFSAFVAKTKPATLLIGEAWASNAIASKYHGAGNGLPMTFDFDAQSALLAAAQSGLADGIAAVACGEDGAFPAGYARGTLLANHDMLRWPSQVTDPAERKAAIAALFLLPGTPFLYYGEEVAAENGPGGDDVAKRLPMAWDGTAQGGFTTGTPWAEFGPNQLIANVKSQLADAGSHLRWVQKLIALRSAHPALQTGALQLFAVPDGWLAGIRAQGDDRVLFAVHFDAAVGPAQLPPLAGLGPATLATNLVDATTLAVSAGTVQLPAIPAAGASIYALN